MAVKAFLFASLAFAAPVRYGNTISISRAGSDVLGLKLRNPRFINGGFAEQKPRMGLRGLTVQRLQRRSSQETSMECQDDDRVDKTSTHLTVAKSDPPEYWQKRLLLLGVALLWGTNFPSVKYLLDQGIAPDIVCALRFVVAGVALTPLINWKNVNRRVVGAGVDIGLWIAAGYVAQAFALQSVSSNKAAFICSLQVIVVPFVNSLLGKPLSPSLLGAAAVSLAGVGLLEIGPDNQLTAPDMGDLVCLLQPLCFGMSYIRIEDRIKEFPEESNEIAAFQVHTTAVASLIWVAINYLTHNAAPIDPAEISDPYTIAALLHTGLFSTALTVYLTNTALKDVPAAESSVIVGTEPLWASIFAAILLNEQMTRVDVLGGMLILAGCFLGVSTPSSGDSGGET